MFLGYLNSQTVFEITVHFPQDSTKFFRVLAYYVCSTVPGHEGSNQNNNDKNNKRAIQTILNFRKFNLQQFAKFKNSIMAMLFEAGRTFTNKFRAVSLRLLLECSSEKFSLEQTSIVLDQPLLKLLQSLEDRNTGSN